MGVSLLSNCGDYNHYNYLIKYSKMADRIIVISPFLTVDMPKILAQMPTIRSVELYTNLDGYGMASAVVPAIYKLYEYCYEKEILVSVKYNNRLHGKAYLLYKENENKGCIITSGNFTVNGLKNNYEYGVFLDNESMQKELVNQIYSLNCLEITYEEVVKLYKELEEFSQKYSVHNIPVFKASDYISSKIIMPDNCKFFLKALGNKENPVEQGYIIDNEIGFSQRPSSVSKGDILICCGKKVGNILGGYKVLEDEPKEGIVKYGGDRWNFKFVTSCISENYSSHWWDYDIKTSDLVDEYNKIKGQDKHVTARGGDTTYGLQKGYIEITKEFAQFVMDNILKV